MVLDDDCAFSSLLQKYHHVVFGTTARLPVSINGEKEMVCKGVQFWTQLI